jgi:hypothetical protein
MPMKLTKKVSVVTTERCVLKLDRDEIVRLLRHAGVNIPDGPDICVDFLVPGGGDWSNTTVDVDAEHPVTVAWSMRKSEERDG